MNVEKLEKGDDEIKMVLIEAVLMPNGELIRYGKSLGFQKDFKGVWILKEAQKK